MSALIILVVVILWAGLGFVLWKSLVRSHIRPRWVLVGTTLVLAGIWFIGPVLDEILGANEFDRICREIPETKFYKPIGVGAGVFFDDSGHPRWKDEAELLAIMRNTRAWDDLFGSRQEWTTLRAWPFPILQSRSINFERKTGTPVVESFYRTSPGGWIKRMIGWGAQAPYQCPSKGKFPNASEWIVFKAN